MDVLTSLRGIRRTAWSTSTLSTRLKISPPAEAHTSMAIQNPPVFTRPTPMDAPGLMNSATSRHIEVDYADERQVALRNNLMTKGLSMGRDLTQEHISKVKSSKLVERFGP
jgi:hypothetical protein